GTTRPGSAPHANAPPGGAGGASSGVAARFPQRFPAGPKRTSKSEAGLGTTKNRASPSATEPEETSRPGSATASRGGLPSRLLDLDLDVDAGGQVEALERLHRLAGGLDDVEEALVDAHLEVLAGVLVDVG